MKKLMKVMRKMKTTLEAIVFLELGMVYLALTASIPFLSEKIDSTAIGAIFFYGVIATIFTTSGILLIKDNVRHRCTLRYFG